MRIWTTHFYHGTAKVYTVEVDDFKEHYRSVLVKNPKGPPHQLIPASSCFLTMVAALGRLEKKLEEEVRIAREKLQRAKESQGAQAHGGVEEAQKRLRVAIVNHHYFLRYKNNLEAPFWTVPDRFLEK